MAWIRLHEKFLEWGWFDRPEMVQIFIYLLLRANRRDREWHGIVVPRGQLATTIKEITRYTRLSPQVIRTCIKKLVETHEISQKSTNKYSIITICKYDYYQERPTCEQQTKNKQLASEQQTNDKQLTSLYNKTEEKTERIKENINSNEFIQKKVGDEKFSTKTDETAKPQKHHYAPEVLLTENEYKTLVERYGTDAAAWMIQKLDDYKAARGTTYKSDYRAILNWVVKEYQKQQTQNDSDFNRATRAEREAAIRQERFAQHIAAKLNAGSDGVSGTVQGQENGPLPF